MAKKGVNPVIRKIKGAVSFITIRSDNDLTTGNITGVTVFKDTVNTNLFFSASIYGNPTRRRVVLRITLDEITFAETETTSEISTTASTSASDGSLAITLLDNTNTPVPLDQTPVDYVD